jgi:pseudouridine-5'-phosphate glycosidase
MRSDITLSTEVADALRSNVPVVALESTLITHGLPWPANAETCAGDGTRSTRRRRSSSHDRRARWHDYRRRVAG